MSHTRKILVMGLPGSGKTTLSTALSRRLSAVHFNADDVRANVNVDLGFSLSDRIEHARRMGWLCDRVVEAGGYAIADFVCPTEATRASFCSDGAAFVVWVNRIREGRFEDTNTLFEPPFKPNICIGPEGSPEFWTDEIAKLVVPTFDMKAPTALFVGRYQPFHDGHKRLIEAGIDRVGQACIAVRETHGTDTKNPFSFEQVRARIEMAMNAHVGRFIVKRLPNITSILYGRDVGYSIERIELQPDIESISGTIIRDRLALT